MMFNRISEGLGTDGLYGDVCNEIVFCPGGATKGCSSRRGFHHRCCSEIHQEMLMMSAATSVLRMTNGGKSGTRHICPRRESDSIYRPASIDLESAIATNPQVTIHSTPVSLGSMSRQSDGTYRLEINDFPKSIEVGWHMLHLTGSTASGRLYDLYRTIFVRGQKR